MDSESLQKTAASTIDVHGSDRWQVYRRLRELGIACQCRSYQSLKADVSTPTTALQVWSVVRQVTASRLTLAASLQACWQLPEVPDQTCS